MRERIKVRELVVSLSNTSKPAGQHVSEIEHVQREEARSVLLTSTAKRGGR